MSEPWSTVDIACATLLFISTLFGLWRGLFRELCSLLIWILAFVVGFTYAAAGGNVALGHLIDSQLVRSAVAFLALFLAVLIAGSFTMARIAAVISSNGLSTADRFLGALFGLARGGLIVMIAVIMARPLFGATLWWENSVLIGVADRLLQLFPLVDMLPGSGTV